MDVDITTVGDSYRKFAPTAYKSRRYTGPGFWEFVFIILAMVLGFLFLHEKIKHTETKQHLAASEAATLRRFEELEALKEKVAEEATGRKRVDAEWSRMYKEASDRAAMWLAKYNELRKGPTPAPAQVP